MKKIGIKRTLSSTILLCLIAGCGVNAGNPLAGPNGSIGSTKQPDVKNLVPQQSISYSTELNPLADSMTLRISEVLLFPSSDLGSKNFVSLPMPQVKETVFVAGNSTPTAILENVSLPQGNYEKVMFVVDSANPGNVKGKRGNVFELELETFVDPNGRKLLVVPSTNSIEVKALDAATDSATVANSKPLVSFFNSDRLIVKLLKWVAERIRDRQEAGTESEPDSQPSLLQQQLSK